MKYLVFFLTTFFSIGVFANALKIGYINIDHLITSSPQFIEANQRVIKAFKPQEEALLALQSKLEAMVEKYNTNKDQLSKDNAQLSIQQIAQAEQQLKQQATSLQEQLKLTNEQELAKIQDLINQTIKEIASKQAFDLILYQEVAYASKKVNITELIAQSLRDKFN